MSGTVLVTGTSVAEKFLAPLRDAGLKIENPTELLTEQQLAEHLSGSAAYLLGGDEIATRKALASARKLKIVAFLGVGYESFIDVPAATELGIAVTNTPGTLTQSVAEFAIGQTINATRQLSVYGTNGRAELKGGNVVSEEKRHDLNALRVGIVGLGAIGTRIAEVLTKGFGCKVAYYSRTRKLDEERRLSIEYAALDELLKTAQVILLMLPGNPTTKHIISSRELSLVQPGTILINIARPELVEPEALFDALRSNRISTAVFDGFYEDDQPKKKELLSLPEQSLIVTRHIASLTHEARDGMAKKAVSSILTFLRTGDDPYVVNRKR